MLRHGLFDVELTLNRTLVFGVLTALVVAAYAAVVYGIQAVAPGSRWGIWCWSRPPRCSLLPGVTACRSWSTVCCSGTGTTRTP